MSRTDLVEVLWNIGITHSEVNAALQLVLISVPVFTPPDEFILCTNNRFHPTTAQEDPIPAQEVGAA
jgi:hypothetical protein